jgi:phosphoserine phosphatase RsbX
MVDVIRGSAIRTRAKSGASENGDAAAVFKGADWVSVIVVDALGANDAAASTAQRALHAAEATAGRDVDDVLSAVHAALRGSSGAAAMAVRIRPGELRIASVGNIAVTAHGMSLAVVGSPGILGFQHAAVEVQRAAMQHGVRLALFTDGVSPSLNPAHGRDVDVNKAADDLFRRHAVSFDDATLVLIDV